MRGPEAGGRLSSKGSSEGNKSTLCCYGLLLQITFCEPKLERIFAFQMAAVAALCVQYESDFRPNMTIVVKALQPLVNKAAAATAGGPSST